MLKRRNNWNIHLIRWLPNLSLSQGYYLGVIVILFIAAYARFSTGFVPIIDADIKGYISPALSWLKNHEFTHKLRAFPYPLFCAVVLTITKSFLALVAIQFLSGILSILLLAVLFRKWILYLNNNWTSYILALLLLLFIALFPKEIIFEKSIRPEAIIALSFTVFFYGMSIFFIGNKRSPVLITGLIAFNFFLYFLFPRWGFGLPFVCATIAWYCFFSEDKVKLLTAYSLGLLISFSCFYLPEQRLISKYDCRSRMFLTKQYFFVHAAIISENIGSMPPAFVGNKMDSIAYHYVKDSLAEFVSQNRNNSLLGFNSDALMYGKMSRVFDSLYSDNYKEEFKSNWGIYPSQIKNRKKGDRVDSLLHVALTNHKYSRLGDAESTWQIHFLAQIIQNSLGRDYRKYVLKVVRQLQYYYSQYLDQGGMIEYSKANYAIYHMKNLDEELAVFDQYKNIIPNSEIMKFNNKQVIFCNAIYTVIKYCYLPLTLVVLIFTLFYDNQSRKPLWFLSLHFSLVLTVAVIHTFDISRYGQSLFIPVTFCFFLLAIQCLPKNHTILSIRNFALPFDIQIF